MDLADFDFEFEDIEEEEREDEKPGPTHQTILVLGQPGEKPKRILSCRGSLEKCETFAHTLESKVADGKRTFIKIRKKTSSQSGTRISVDWIRPKDVRSINIEPIGDDDDDDDEFEGSPPSSEGLYPSADEWKTRSH